MMKQFKSPPPGAIFTLDADLKKSLLTPQRARPNDLLNPSYTIPRAQRRLNELRSPIIPLPVPSFDIAPQQSDYGTLDPATSGFIHMEKQINRKNKREHVEEGGNK